MAEEPSLPQLPPSISWNECTQSFSNQPRKRVRTRRSSSAAPLFNNSSDPAVFSSDDDPALDNYVEGRRKRRYVGSWFHQQPASSDSAFDEPRGPTRVVPVPLPRTKRTLKRQLDSGVWMGSDGTDDCLEDVPLPAEARLPQLDVDVALDRAPPAQKPVISQAEQLARQRIRECLDEGEENVDLSFLGLESASDATIKPLEELSCIPIVAENVPFEHRDPSLKLYLSGNPLARLPGAIFDLQHLTYLSLRGCRLRELPPAIGRLQQLETLNLAQNCLKFLPAELVDLLAAPGNLRSLLLQGNDFYQASQLPEQVTHAEVDGNTAGLEADENVETGPPRPKILRLESCDGSSTNEKSLRANLPAPLEGHVARYLARSPVQYSDTSGFTYSAFDMDKLQDRTVPAELEGYPSASELPLGMPPSSAPYASKSVGRHVSESEASGVPSLLELAARSCYRSPDLEDLASYLPDSLAHVRNLLERAVEQRRAGGCTCCKCGKTMVMPATRWLEWWQVARVKRCLAADGTVALTSFAPWSDNSEERAVPFMRVGCSWKCVPRSRELGWWAVRDDARDE